MTAQENWPARAFLTRCPAGHQTSQQHSIAELENPSVRFACAECHQTWIPKEPDRARALRWVTGAAPIKTAFLTCVGCETRLTTVYEPGYNPAVVAWHLVHCPVQTCKQLLKIDVPGHLVMIEPAGPSPSAWSRFTSIDGLH